MNASPIENMNEETIPSAVPSKLLAYFVKRMGLFVKLSTIS